MDISEVYKVLDALDKKLDAFATKAAAEVQSDGKVAKETKDAIDKLGEQQLEQAQRLIRMEQAQVKGEADPTKESPTSWGEQFVKTADYQSFVRGGKHSRAEVKATFGIGDVPALTPSTTLFKPGVMGPLDRRLSVESLFNAVPTTAYAIEWLRETGFTNNAAETAEKALKPESSLTFDLQNTTIKTVAHWTRITRQLAADAPALVAYIETRMKYGLQLRIENQLIVGNGTAPNIKGVFTAGNYTVHGIAGAGGQTSLDIIAQVLGQAESAFFAPNAIVMNPADWWTMTLAKDTTGRYLLTDPHTVSPRTLWGIRVVVTPAMPADNFLVGAFDMAATLYNREGVTVDLSEHDQDNFVKNLITIRVERRLELTVERPSALIGGDLTPA